LRTRPDPFTLGTEGICAEITKATSAACDRHRVGGTEPGESGPAVDLRNGTDRL